MNTLWLAGPRTALWAALPLTLTLAHAQTSTQAAVPLLTTASVSRTVLPNGLTVLTKEVHAAPVVTVQVYYKIGSRNEAPGVNGIAHQLEHMMFKGTADRPIQFGRLFNALGSQSNAFTSYDQTGYYGTVQREKATALLTLEADRMRASQIDPEKLASERKVVLSEIQGNENSPAYRLSRAVQRAAFPNSPYGLTVGGTKADIEGFSADKVRAYYQQYYAPQYATLVIVGDFKTPEMLLTVQRLFGNLGAPGTQPVTVSAPLSAQGSAPQGPEATLNSPAAKDPIVLREPGATPILNAVYPLPSIKSQDTAPLKVMDFILLSGRSSRLYQSLFQSGLAAGGGTSPNQFLGGGWYDVSFTPAPGKSLQAVDQAYLKSVAELQQNLVGAGELKRAKTLIRAYALLGSRSITDQAQQLGIDATTANDFRYTDEFLAAIDKVSAEGVRRVAQTYLAQDKRTVGYFEPTEAAQGAPAPAANTSQTTESFNAGPPVDPAEVAQYLPAFPPPGQTEVALPEQVTLPNGLRIFLQRSAATPSVSLSGAVIAGREFDGDVKAGLADLVAGNLLSGTKTRSADQIGNLLDDNGVSLSASASRYQVSLGGVSTAQALPVMVDVLADVLKNASFPADEFQLSQARTLQGLKGSEDSPGSVAQKVFQQTLYPAGSPFHPFAGQASVAALTDADLQAFYNAHYRPDTTILSFVGDFDPATLKALLTEKLGSWKAEGTAPSVTYPPAPAPKGIVRVTRDLAGKTESVTYLGYPTTLGRKDPRFYAAQVLNQVVGGDTLSSRLGSEVRDRAGLTYGISSAFQASLHPGAFLVALQTAPGDAGKAVQATLALLSDVRENGLKPAEVETAKKSLLSGYAVGLADPDNLAGAYTGNALLGLPQTELRDYQAKLNAVTLEQVNAVAKELLDPANILVVTAGPPAK